MHIERAKPFLRWAGGKSKIVHHLQAYIPINFAHYWEPFLGAGALFFSLGPADSYLSDLNSDLIECYRQVRDNPEPLYRYLRYHALRTSEKYYYEIRNQYNRCSQSAAQAARFIYLNKTSFNGIFRVNLRGEYNVPYGHKEPPPLPTKNEILSASKLLQRATLETEGFEVALEKNKPGGGDFVYLDPPYPPLNGTSYFTHYTSSRFSWQDQKKLADLAFTLAEEGVYVMISNANTDEIRELYSEWHLHPLPVVRWIAANGKRYKVSELVITSYPAELFDREESHRHKGNQ